MLTSNHQSAPAGDLADALFDRREPRKARRIAGWVGALAAHAFIVTMVSAGVVQGRSALPPIDVEFLAPPPAPPPELPRIPEPPSPRSAPTTRSAGSPPPAARAGALLTAKENAPKSQQPEEPVDFTTDPNGTTYGGGVVAVGGKADFGKAGAHALGTGVAEKAAPAAKGMGDGLTPAADLSQKPRLNEADPCRGYFPRNATDDVAQVSLAIIVGKNGRVSSTTLVSESPAAQGFGAAARACILAKQFVPALDRAGNAAATATRINLRFAR